MPNKLKKTAERKLMSVPQMRAAEFAPATINDEKRTVDLVWSTGAQVTRRDWDGDPYIEELSMDPKHIRMGRLNAGAPLLRVHSQWDLSDILGVVERADISDGKGTATVRFSERSDVDPFFKDVKSGIIRNVSVGYRVHKWAKVSAKDDEVPVYRAVDWEPFEISLVPVGADASAGTRSASDNPVPCEIVERAEGAEEGDNMPPENDQNTRTAPAAAPAAPAAATVDVEAVRAEAVAVERKRVSEIQTAVRTAKLGDDFAQKLIESGKTIDQARADIIEEWGKRGEAPAASVRAEAGAQDEMKVRAESIESALLHRFDSEKHPLEKNAREYASMSLLEMAKEVLEGRGIKTRIMSKMDVAGRALTTSDFQNIVANVANKSLRESYEAAPQTFWDFTREAMLPDFKPVSRVQLGDAPSLELVGEDAEVKRGGMIDQAESYKLGTYAKILAITRQTIINDDLDALTRIPMLFGRAAADLESDLIYGIFAANAGLGATLLTDQKSIFHAAHNNAVALGAGGAISVQTIGAGRSAMKQQKNLQKRPMNVQPIGILVPTALETAADQFTTQALLANQPGNTNPFAGRLKVVSEPRLDAISAAAWYLFASYSQIDIFELAYLQGQKGVYFETKPGFDVEGMEFKARLDVGVKAIDYRGLYRNAGA